MDPRNYRFGPAIDPNRGVRMSIPDTSYPVPAFFRIEEERYFVDIPEGVAKYSESGLVGMSLDEVWSYHPGSGYYYGRKGTKLARYHEDDIGTEGKEEIGIDMGSGNPLHVYRVDHDDVTHRFIFVHGGKLYYLDDFTAGTPVETLDFADYGGATPTPAFTQIDTDGYGRVLVTQYSTEIKKTPFHVFLSRDFGQSWDLILDIVDDLPDASSQDHVHCVRFDPYDNWIWVAMGDVSPAAQVLVSPNEGETWHPIYPWNDAQVQATEIMLFPDHVVLGPDTAKHEGLIYIPRGMIRHRVFNGEPLNLHDLYFENIWSYGGNEVSFYTSSTQSHSQRLGYPGRPLVAVGMDARANRGSPVFITRDGYKWHEVLRLGVNATTWRMFGPDGKNRIYGVGNGFSYVFEAPKWSDELTQ